MKKNVSGALNVLCLAFAVTLLTNTLPANAQVGAGPAPPSATAIPDQFANFTWQNNCVPVTSCTMNVYRGIVTGGVKGRINPNPITTNSYRDASTSTPPPSFGVLNFYNVTAVRVSDGVESVPSAEVSATAKQGNGSVPPPSNVNAVLAFLIEVGKAVLAGLKQVGHFLG